MILKKSYSINWATSKLKEIYQKVRKLSPKSAFEQGNIILNSMFWMNLFMDIYISMIYHSFGDCSLIVTLVLMCNFIYKKTLK